MKTHILLLALLTSIIFSIDISYIENELNWEVLQDSEIKISYKEINNQPYCKASKIFNFKPTEIKNILDDKSNYPKYFKRIIFCESINKEIVHIGVNLPFPFSPRDYVVEYQYFKNKNREYYIYESVIDTNEYKNKKFVRLPNASGIWLIEKIEDNKTKLTYLWQSELLGNIPNWVLPKAWKEQGSELLNQLDIALKNR